MTGDWFFFYESDCLVLRLLGLAKTLGKIFVFFLKKIPFTGKVAQIWDDPTSPRAVVSDWDFFESD